MQHCLSYQVQMKLSYKYRLYPTRVQREALDGIFSACRFLYNNALEQRVAAYRTQKKSLSYSFQCSEIVGVVDFFPEFANVYSQTRQQVLKTVDTAFKNFFRRVREKANKAGFPRFKNKFRFRSICFPQVSSDLSAGGVSLLPNGKLKVFGIPNELKLVMHRPFQGRCKQARIVREADRLFLVLSCDGVPKAPLPKTDKSIGIDLGLKTFIVASDGTKFRSPKPYKTSLEKLRFKQQKLAAKLVINGNKRTNNVVRLRGEIAKHHAHVANVRKDFAHKIANELFKRYDTVCYENLDIQEMLEQERAPDKPAPLNRNITDAAWGLFASLLPYKAERADKVAIAVPPKGTSKTCSNCGYVKETLSLQERIYHCEACGFAMDRDLNAAINIQGRGTRLAA
jgi:putative transposase